MKPGDVSLRCAAALVDGLVRSGATLAAVSPGSRSTPLALALARDRRISVHVHLDERSAAFFALGAAKATGAPAVVACTSGTAAAELFPAVVEASQSRTPLVLLTADRPPDVRGTGANQTIDQRQLFGRYARRYVEPPLPGSPSDADVWLDAGLDAGRAATHRPAGPVQVDCPFPEDLTPTGDAAASPVSTAEDRGGGVDAPPNDVIAGVRDFVETYGGRNGLIAIGGLPRPRTLSLLSLGTLLGWPVLAEPLSGLRLDASDAGRALSAGQFLIGDDGWLDGRRPDVVLQVGAAPTTRTTQSLVGGTGALVVLDEMHLDPDPAHRAQRRIARDPERFAAAAWDSRDEVAFRPPPGWLEGWRSADLVVRTAIDRALDRWDEPFEGRVARDVASFLPHGATLVVGSSLPVRDLDAYMAPRRPPRIWNGADLLRVIGNRGASGIDGVVSTILGAAAGSASPTVGLIGDLSFLYDAGAVLWSSRVGVDAVLVVLSNGGGQIFSMLDQVGLPEFDDLFLTPHPASIARVCDAGSVPHTAVERAKDINGAVERALRVGGVQVIEVVIDPERDRARREELRGVVHDVLRSH